MGHRNSGKRNTSLIATTDGKQGTVIAIRKGSERKPTLSPHQSIGELRSHSPTALPPMTSLRDPKRKPSRPGELLREDVLPALGMSQTEIARVLGVSRRLVSALRLEKRAMSPDMAVRVGRLTRTTPDSGLSMQTAMDLWELQRAPNVTGISIR